MQQVLDAAFPWPKTDAYSSHAYGQVCVAGQVRAPCCTPSPGSGPAAGAVLFCDGGGPLVLCAYSRMKTEGSSTVLLLFSCG